MTLTQYIAQVREEWEQSEVAKRIMASECSAIIHGAPEWHGETVQDFWEAKIREREAALRGEIGGMKIGKSLGKSFEDNRLNVYIDGYNQAITDILARIFDTKDHNHDRP